MSKSGSVDSEIRKAAEEAVIEEFAKLIAQEEDGPNQSRANASQSKEQETSEEIPVDGLGGTEETPPSRTPESMRADPDISEVPMTEGLTDEMQTRLNYEIEYGDDEFGVRDIPTAGRHHSESDKVPGDKNPEDVSVAGGGLQEGSDE